jgi:ATP-dependent exoDNAse (exonuclease V) beta subunit
LEENIFNRLLPEAFSSHITYLGKLPVYELSEQLIRIFSLNDRPDAYIQRFQDLVLEYSSISNSSLEGFLQWWDNSNKVKNASVIIPESTDAIRIMTIHRSKGLQFPIVFMPFTEWSITPKANELMWMKTSNTPYEELGQVVVSSSNRLKDSHFKLEYEKEVFQTVVDNLNLLYVGFTRAEKKLFITCPIDNDKDLNSVSKLISRTCVALNPAFNNKFFERGTDSSQHEMKEDKEKGITSEYLNSYPSTRWQEKLALSTHSGDLLSMFEDKQMTKVNYGILVHSVLAAIQRTTEIDSVIDKIVFEGLIGDEEKKHLKKEINEVLANPDISRFFEDGFTVRAERELILPNGEVLRPDRVIIKDEIATVIDFKTGRREKKHEDQLRQYAGILGLMNYKSVNAHLIYLSERIVLEVKTDDITIS